MNPLKIAGAVASLTLAACASGPGPDLSGPQGPSLMAAYSGDWVLLRLESDDLAAKMRESAGEGARPGMGAGGGFPGGRTGGGMPGGRTGGGMPGARPGGGGMPGGGDPETMRGAMEMIQTLVQTPTELSLTLAPERVILAAGEGAVTDLLLGAEEMEIRAGRLRYFAAAAWTRKGIEIRRKTESGAGVDDRVSLDDQGRLVISREIHLPMGRGVKGTLVYRKGS